jgi:Mg2+ and Co2+ transporter CorA
VFAGLARPDFHPTDEGRANEHFLSLDTRFERAMGMVENSRDLVIGSFELFSSQTSLLTNDTMRVLTFVTVVVGLLAVLAGVLGMNPEAPCFKTGGTGFWIAAIAVLVLAIVAAVVGKRRHWL